MRNVKRSTHWSHLVVRGLFAVALAAFLLVSLQSGINRYFSNTASVPGPTAVATQSAAAAPAPATPDKSSQSPPLPMESQPAASTNCVGDEVCRSCHQGVVDAYHQTAHFLTSRLPTADSIGPKFSRGSNFLETLNPNVCFEMESNEDGYFETAVVKGNPSPTTRLQTHIDVDTGPKTQTRYVWKDGYLQPVVVRGFPSQVTRRTERIDIIVGSGRKAQTYLFWKGDRLFELPVSYWVELGEWGNSPGYTDGSAYFSRAIVPRCLECHANSFESLAPPANRFNRTSLVLGITCEKCHGPGREHVERFRSEPPPQSPAGTAIINPDRLLRDRQVDACGLCHAGGEARVPSLSFVPGDVLDKFVFLPKPDPQAHMDVHGNQVELLQRSRCFQSGPTMTCTTCHDVHKPQRDLAAFASRCLTCHEAGSCGTFPKLGHEIDGKCVVCHMPLQQSGLITLSINGKVLQPKVRNHHIAIYPDVQLH
jgi:hypothetical protein